MTTRVISGGSTTCSRLPEDSAAQTGSAGHACMTLSAVSMPSARPTTPCSPMLPSRTAPPATEPSIMRGFGHVGLARAVRRQIGAVDGDLLAGGITHDRDQRRIAGARIPVGQIGVEQEVGRLGNLQAAAGQVGLAGSPSERDRARQDELDLASGALGALLPGEALGDRVPGAVDRRRAGELGRVLDQRPPGQARSRARAC